MDRTIVSHHSHFGAFNAIVEDGRVVGAIPFPLDPDPSPLIEAIPDSVHSPTRIPTPMVREGWAPGGGDPTGQGRTGRGRDRFVPVSWDRALDLVAGELSRVRREHGPGAVMGGSQGWSSAGLFHEARASSAAFSAPAAGLSTRSAITASAPR
jgi:biotin/methionine sulfoxide reductase